MNDADQKRRGFLKKAGKFAAYTPPAILLLMNPSLQAFAKSGGGGMSRPGKGVRGARGARMAQRRSFIQKWRAKFGR
jgi:hypothetical protein